ncbi:xanthine dehydrogenase molybdopterin binding subunit [Alteromonas lipolytica]|uniref:Xanthine dehydrogenase molybdopterin binding subunit n=1 Tax=Alteromonas lipolytica TaxID=1856405 RepID=A0A1E8FLR6_9ALTE|nr:xanthine dehydrogenase molybdopterin binding subunit [Alteromonas lipolytica]OFI36373.1 xanthine dehydrogenase molybdopterin binding subunit [Alteromonas lipolytica]GGF70448.1 xanthine dehydrogenase molybdopterin binding subunit [Alteromonas lipolytica]
MRKLVEQPINKADTSPLLRSEKHESAIRQVSGSARYVDDIPAPDSLCYASVGVTNVTSGQLEALDLSSVWQSPGVIDVITIDDIPGHTDIGAVFGGDPILLDKEVKFHGQPVFAVLAETEEQARIAATRAQMRFSQSEPLLTTEAALAADSKVRPTHEFGRGDVEATFNHAPLTASGHLSVGGQEHMYLEGQVSLAIPEEEDRMSIFTSSQHPSEVQKLVAEVLDVKLHRVAVDMRRMGGGFGGKESQAAQWACLAAVFALRTRRAVKMRLPRMMDMQVTGKRHPFENDYAIAFNEQGKMLGAKITVSGNCGHSPDLSDAIVDRAMFHVDNAYQLGDTHVVGHRLKTNMVSHTAFRGFGGPQGLIVAEQMMDVVARKTGLDPLTVRKLNLYGPQNGMTTPYGMPLEQDILADIIAKLEADSEYWQRREQIRAYNAQSPIIKKGLALTPVKFGISFTAKHLNQAGALIHIYTDGSIQVNHGGTEMGQGLHTKIGQIVAHEFGVTLDNIEVTSTRTDKVPNTSPTAASSGTDLNGKAAQNACITIKERLAALFSEEFNVTADEVIFANGHVMAGGHSLPFTQLIQNAYMARISLSATGYYRTPKIFYDRDTGSGRPFFYFANGAAGAEVSVDTLTGEYTLDKVDILHDVGTSLNPAIDRGQIEGGFIQGMGWLTSEDLRWDDSGRLISNNMATYKIPAIGDTPDHFNVALFDRPNAEDSIYHSKAVGEPPFMLAISVWCAIKDAIASVADYQQDPALPAPATPEKVLMAINALRGEA